MIQLIHTVSSMALVLELIMNINCTLSAVIEPFVKQYATISPLWSTYCMSF